MARYVMFDFWNKLHGPSALEVLGDGKQVRDSPLIDTVRIDIGEAWDATEAYNVSSGRSLSVTEMAHAMISALGDGTDASPIPAAVGPETLKMGVSNDKIRSLGYTP
jgi:nucleoside-diphosphate-sugar epimerase